MQIPRFSIPRPSTRLQTAPLVVLTLAFGGCGGTDGGSTDGSPVTADQFSQIPLGVALGEIRYELGEPAAERRDDGRDCLDYPESRGDGIGRSRIFRLCFREGILVAKNAY